MSALAGGASAWLTLVADPASAATDDRWRTVITVAATALGVVVCVTAAVAERRRRTAARRRRRQARRAGLDPDETSRVYPPRRGGPPSADG